LQIHLYLGLSLGAIFAVVGLTGSLIVFWQPIDALLNPEWFEVSALDVRRPVIVRWIKCLLLFAVERLPMGNFVYCPFRILNAFCLQQCMRYLLQIRIGADSTLCDVTGFIRGAKNDVVKNEC
jgi:hypothetical protein